MLDWFAAAAHEKRQIVMRAWYELWLARNSARESKRIEDPGVMGIAERVFHLGKEWNTIREDPMSQPVH